MSKSMEIKYHYAHIATQGKKVSLVDLIDLIKGTIRINDSMVEGGAIFVRFSSEAIKLIFDKGNNQLDLDLYSGIVRVNTPHGYHYNGKTGYYANFSGIIGCQDTEDFGYVVESPPRLAILFIKKLAFVESFQMGKVKIHVSSLDLDLNGYIDFLFGEGILTLARIAEPSPLPPFKDMVIKELQEQKDEAPILSTTIEEVPIEVVGQHHETDVTFHS
jgi:hypothetical protein